MRGGGIKDLSMSGLGAGGVWFDTPEGGRSMVYWMGVPLGSVVSHVMPPWGKSGKGLLIIFSSSRCNATCSVGERTPRGSHIWAMKAMSSWSVAEDKVYITCGKREILRINDYPVFAFRGCLPVDYRLIPFLKGIDDTAGAFTLETRNVSISVLAFFSLFHQHFLSKIYIFFKSINYV